MKCDELKAETIVPQGCTITLQMYPKAEVDAAIAELKKKLMPCLNGDCILTCEVVEKYGKENAELKAENERLKKQSSCTFSDDSLRVRQLKRKIADNSEKILELQKSLDVALSEVYSLLDKIESLKASHYAEMVDADENLRWRKTSEEIPSENDYYLVSDGKNVFMEYGSYNEQDEVWNWDHGENMDTWKYWRPMPKAPEEAK